MQDLHIKKQNLIKFSNYLIYLSFFLILSESIWFSFRNFNIGVVGETEAVIIAFYLFSGLLSMGIISKLLLDKNNNIIKNFCSHPLTIYFFLIAIISFIFSSFTSLPIRSWFGSFTTGEGVFGYLAITVCVIASFYIKQSRKIYKISSIIVLVSTLFITFMQYYGDNIGLYRPYPMFNSFLAFYGLFLLPILFCALKPKNKYVQIAIILISLFIVYLSDNRTALLALLGTIIIFGLFLFLKYKKVRHLRLYITILILLAPITILVTTYVIGAYVYKKTENFSLASMYTRYNMHDSIIEYQKDASLVGKLFGNGWGSYQDIKKRELPIYRINIYDVHPMDRELLYDTHFHSHHSVLEALFSIGILGALLIWLLPAIIVWLCPGRYLLLSIWTGFFYSSLSSMWFQLPLTVPLMVLAFAGLSKDKSYFLNKYFKKTINVFKIRIWILIIIIISLFSAALILYQKRIYRPIDPLAWDKYYYLSDYGKNWYDFYPDYYQGGQRLAYIFDLYNRQLLKIKNNTPLMNEELNSLRMLHILVNKAIENNQAGIALIVIDMEYINNWHNSNMPITKDNIVIQEMFNNWQYKLKNLLKHAPERTDLAVPYLTMQLEKNNYEAIEEIIEPILAKDDSDPVGLWFKAKVLKQRYKNIVEAQKFEKRALKNKIDNIIKLY